MLEEKGGLTTGSTKVASAQGAISVSAILDKSFSLPQVLKKLQPSKSKAEVTGAKVENDEEDLSKLVLSEQEKFADRRSVFVSSSGFTLRPSKLLKPSPYRTFNKNSWHNSEGTYVHQAFGK